MQTDSAIEAQRVGVDCGVSTGDARLNGVWLNTLDLGCESVSTGPVVVPRRSLPPPPRLAPRAACCWRSAPMLISSSVMLFVVSAAGQQPAV